MNLDTWNSLPTDIQKIFDDYSTVEKARDRGRVWDVKTVEALDNVIIPYDQEHGNPPIYTPPKEEKARWVEAVTPLYEEWIADREAKGLPARAFIDDLLKLAEKYNP